MLVKYELILYWSESDRAFIVEVPELPIKLLEDEIRADLDALEGMLG